MNWRCCKIFAFEKVGEEEDDDEEEEEEVYENAGCCKTRDQASPRKGLVSFLDRHTHARCAASCIREDVLI